jgi:cell division septum initiation protein DivIVA
VAQPVCEDEDMSDPRRDLLPMHEAQHSFDVVLRGYDRSQVADTIERLEADFRIAIADRDAAAARSADLASQLSALHAEIDSLRRKAANASAPTFENISERIQHMLQLAEEEAAEIRRAAESDAMAVREQTAAEERALLERHAAGQAEVERMLAEARQSAEQIAQKAQIRADELVAKAQERVARLDAESQARRAKVEEDFDIAQRARRAESARAEEERERVSTQAARQRISAAEQHAAQLVAEAEARAEAIREVRDELTGRLIQARQLLDGLPDLGDRAQPAAPQPVAAVPAVSAPEVREPERRPSPNPAPAPTPAPAQTTLPAAGRGVSEAGAARQPTRTETPVAAYPAAGQDRSAEAPVTRQLPMPPRPSPTPGGSSATSVQGPPTQTIDQPAGQGRS